MAIIVDKMVYPTLDLALTQVLGRARKVDFAFYEVIDTKFYENASQLTFSIIYREVPVEDKEDE